MEKISYAKLIDKIGRGDSVNGSGKPWSWEVLNYSMVKEVPTKGGRWRFHLRQNYSPPELVERGIKPADSVAAFYRPTETDDSEYLFMSSPETPPNLEEAVRNADILTKRLLEKKSWLGKKWQFAVVAGAVVPVAGLETANYFLGSPMKLDVRATFDMFAFMLGGAVIFESLYSGRNLTRRTKVKRAVDNMYGPDKYVYGEEGMSLLEAESGQFTKALAEEKVYQSAGVQVGRLEFHKQLETLVNLVKERR